MVEAIMAAPGAESQSSIRSGAEELEDRQIVSVAVLMVIAGGLGAWLSLPGTSFKPWQFATLALLCIDGLSILQLGSSRRLLARALVLAGPSLAFALALRHLNYAGVAAYAIIPLLLSFSVHHICGLASVLINMASLVFLRPADPFLPSAIILLLVVGVIEGLSSHSHRFVIEWAWASERRASALLRDLRSRQG